MPPKMREPRPLVNTVGSAGSYHGVQSFCLSLLSAEEQAAPQGSSGNDGFRYVPTRAVVDRLQVVRKPDGSIWVGETQARLLTRASHLPPEHPLFTNQGVQDFVASLNGGQQLPEDERELLKETCQEAIK